MDNNQLGLAAILFILGIIGHLTMRRSMDIGNKIRSLVLNEKGEGDAGGDLKFTDAQQKHIDGLIAAKAADYHNKLTPLQKQLDELGKFKSEYEKSQETRSQEELVKAKKYEEAEGTYKKQINEFSGKLSAKDMEIQDLKIGHALTNEISKQGGFIEETAAMIKASAILDANGSVVIKTKDANGADIQVPLADGIKKFLTERPHLVKSTYKGGSGSQGGTGDGDKGGAGGAGGEDLTSLNAQLAEANKGTDLKLRSVIKGKIKEALAKKNVHR